MSEILKDVGTEGYYAWKRKIIDVGSDLFEAGQMYVALSRLKNLDGLYLEEFSIDSIKINYKVLNYYKNMD